MKPETFIKLGALCQKLFNMADGYEVQIRPYLLFSTIYPVVVEFVDLPKVTDIDQKVVRKQDFVSLQPVGEDRFMFWVGYARNANVLIVMENGISESERR